MILLLFDLQFLEILFQWLLQGRDPPSSKDIASSNLKVFEEPKKVSKKSIAVKLGSVGKSGTSTETSKRKQPEDASVKTKQKAKRVKIFANKGSNVIFF